jgi:hypothetical protein
MIARPSCLLINAQCPTTLPSPVTVTTDRIRPAVIIFENLSG